MKVEILLPGVPMEEVVRFFTNYLVCEKSVKNPVVCGGANPAWIFFEVSLKEAVFERILQKVLNYSFSQIIIQGGEQNEDNDECSKPSVNGGR